MFIIDEFAFLDHAGNPTGRALDPQEGAIFHTYDTDIGGGGTYANIGARLWLPPSETGMIVDKGVDFPPEIDAALKAYGEDMWLFRDQSPAGTTRALNRYKGDHRGFQYLTPRLRIDPRDLIGTSLSRPATLHFICSPARAAVIMSQVAQVEDWSPISVYEPIPDSPNAEEALALLADPSPVSKSSIERACKSFLDFGVGPSGTGSVVIRSGSLGAYVASRSQSGTWIDAYWRTEERVVDVTGDFLLLPKVGGRTAWDPRAYHISFTPLPRSRGWQQFSGWPCRRPHADKRGCF
ncbi:hypothetical protein EDB85DRAFT_1907861 [Lactarius pseudohatsudake]|nr:hypothetical protein EDB85DRAFT_1907861 [Lactarius pseudohatsudake]